MPSEQPHSKHLVDIQLKISVEVAEALKKYAKCKPISCDPQGLPFLIDPTVAAKIAQQINGVSATNFDSLLENAIRAEYVERLGYKSLPEDATCVVSRRFQRVWELFGFLLSKKTRERLYEPAYDDLLLQHAKAQDPKFGKWAVPWLNFCFTIRTIGLVFQCYRAVFTGAALAGLLKCLPPGLKQWAAETWFSLFR